MKDDDLWENLGQRLYDAVLDVADDLRLTERAVLQRLLEKERVEAAIYTAVQGPLTTGKEQSHAKSMAV